MRIWILGSTLLAALFLSSAVLAELIEGEVVSVDTNTNSFRLIRNNPMSGAQEKLNVLAGPTTKFRGVVYLGELQSGTKIRIDARQAEPRGSWVTNLIESVESRPDKTEEEKESENNPVSVSSPAPTYVYGPIPKS